jgi:hypothetical protein
MLTMNEQSFCAVGPNTLNQQSIDYEKECQKIYKTGDPKMFEVKTLGSMMNKQ